jgi:Acyl-CoA carboxylase epsilon subunit
MAERFLRVVHGDPTPEELAALVAVLTARARAASSAAGRPKPRRSAWSDPSRRMHRPLSHGPGAWRSSTFPG